MLLGNKTDKEDERKVTYEEGRALALKENYEFKESSCLQNINVAGAFENLMERWNFDYQKTLRINSENFFAYSKDKATGEFTSSENNTCAHYILEHLITSYVGQAANANPSGMHMYMKILPDGGMIFGGESIHTTVKIDNYPYYPDYNAHPELYPWKDYNPLPCYGNSVNFKGDIFFEYNKDGWLVKESMYSKGYDASSSSVAQVGLEAVYSYEFGPTNP